MKRITIDNYSLTMSSHAIHTLLATKWWFALRFFFTHIPGRSDEWV